MKQSKFLKATLVASVLIVNTFPLIAAETVKESITKSIHSAGEEIEDSAITSKVKIALLIRKALISNWLFSCCSRIEMLFPTRILILKDRVLHSPYTPKMLII